MVYERSVRVRSGNLKLGVTYLVPTNQEKSYMHVICWFHFDYLFYARKQFLVL